MPRPRKSMTVSEDDGDDKKPEPPVQESDTKSEEPATNTRRLTRSSTLEKIEPEELKPATRKTKRTDTEATSKGTPRPTRRNSVTDTEDAKKGTPRVTRRNSVTDTEGASKGTPRVTRRNSVTETEGAAAKGTPRATRRNSVTENDGANKGTPRATRRRSVDETSVTDKAPVTRRRSFSAEIQDVELKRVTRSSGLSVEGSEEPEKVTTPVKKARARRRNSVTLDPIDEQLEGRKTLSPKSNDTDKNLSVILETSSKSTNENEGNLSNVASTSAESSEEMNNKSPTVQEVTVQHISESTSAVEEATANEPAFKKQLYIAIEPTPSTSPDGSLECEPKSDAKTDFENSTEHSTSPKKATRNSSSPTKHKDKLSNEIDANTATCSELSEVEIIRKEETEVNECSFLLQRAEKEDISPTKSEKVIINDENRKHLVVVNEVDTLNEGKYVKTIEILTVEGIIKTSNGEELQGDASKTFNDLQGTEGSKSIEETAKSTDEKEDSEDKENIPDETYIQHKKQTVNMETDQVPNGKEQSPITKLQRVSDVFRPKGIDYSFVEPMEVDSSIILNSTTSKRFSLNEGKDEMGDSFKLRLSETSIMVDVSEKSAGALAGIVEEKDTSTKEDLVVPQTVEEENLDKQDKMKLKLSEDSESVGECNKSCTSEDYEFQIPSEEEDNMDESKAETQKPKKLVEEEELEEIMHKYAGENDLNGSEAHLRHTLNLSSTDSNNDTNISEVTELHITVCDQPELNQPDSESKGNEIIEKPAKDDKDVHSLAKLGEPGATVVEIQDTFTENKNETSEESKENDKVEEPAQDNNSDQEPSKARLSVTSETIVEVAARDNVLENEIVCVNSAKDQSKDSETVFDTEETLNDNTSKIETTSVSIDQDDHNFKLSVTGATIVEIEDSLTENENLSITDNGDSKLIHINDQTLNNTLEVSAIHKTDIMNVSLSGNTQEENTVLLEEMPLTEPLHILEDSITTCDEIVVEPLDKPLVPGKVGRISTESCIEIDETTPTPPKKTKVSSPQAPLDHSTSYDTVTEQLESGKEKSKKKININDSETSAVSVASKGSSEKRKTSCSDSFSTHNTSDSSGGKTNNKLKKKNKGERTQDMINKELSFETNSEIDEYLSQKITDILESVKDTEGSSSEDRYDEENEFLDTMAEEVDEEETPSEDSNQISDEGETINTTDTEDDRDDDDEYDGSFICSDEEPELLPGDEYDLENVDDRKKTRIINIEDQDDDFIVVERKERTQKPRSFRRIKDTSESSDEHTSDEERVDSQQSAEKLSVKSSETYTLEDEVFMEDMKLAEVNINNEDVNEPGPSEMESHKRKSDSPQLNDSNSKRNKSEYPKFHSGRPFSEETGKRNVSVSSCETETSPKKPKVEHINLNKTKSKNRKHTDFPNMNGGVSPVSDLRMKTFSLMNQLITDVKNRPRRAITPSVSTNLLWDVQKVKVKPSTSMVDEKEKFLPFPSNKVHSKDFRHQMLYDSGRVKRVDTKILLKKRAGY